MPHHQVRIHPLYVLVALVTAATGAGAQTPQEMRLWPGTAPGSEAWTVAEVTTTSPAGDRTIANVSDPRVSVFLPPPATATGAAVVVAPGGALRLLAWDREGTHVAQWLNSQGIADAQQALRLARQHAAAWRIDPAPIGIMGYTPTPSCA